MDDSQAASFVQLDELTATSPWPRGNLVLRVTMMYARQGPRAPLKITCEGDSQTQGDVNVVVHASPLAQYLSKHLQAHDRLLLLSRYKIADAETSDSDHPFEIIVSPTEFATMVGLRRDGCKAMTFRPGESLPTHGPLPSSEGTGNVEESQFTMQDSFPESFDLEAFLSGTQNQDQSQVQQADESTATAPSRAPVTHVQQPEQKGPNDASKQAPTAPAAALHERARKPPAFVPKFNPNLLQSASNAMKAMRASLAKPPPSSSEQKQRYTSLQNMLNQKPQRPPLPHPIGTTTTTSAASRSAAKQRQPLTTAAPAVSSPLATASTTSSTTSTRQEGGVFGYVQHKVGKVRKTTAKSEANYLTLAEAANPSHIGQLVNVYGIVRYSAPLRHTRNDKIKKVTLWDKSWPSSPYALTNPDGLKLNLFGKEEEHLPRINALGDIMRIHRLKMSAFQGNPQGVANFSPAKRESYALFFGEVGLSFDPYDHSGATFTEPSARHIKELRGLVQADATFAEPASYTPMAEITADSTTCDLLLQVLDLHFSNSRISHLVAWDGSRPNLIKPVVESSDLYQNDVAGLHHTPLNRCVCISAANDFAKPPQFVSIGDFFFFKNIAIKPHSDGTKKMLVLSAATTMRKLTPADVFYPKFSKLLSDVREFYQSRMSSTAATVTQIPALTALPSTVNADPLHDDNDDDDDDDGQGCPRLANDASVEVVQINAHHTFPQPHLKARTEMLTSSLETITPSQLRGMKELVGVYKVSFCVGDVYPKDVNRWLVFRCDGGCEARANTCDGGRTCTGCGRVVKASVEFFIRACNPLVKKSNGACKRQEPMPQPAPTHSGEAPTQQMKRPKLCSPARNACSLQEQAVSANSGKPEDAYVDESLSLWVTESHGALFAGVSDVLAKSRGTCDLLREKCRPRFLQLQSFLLGKPTIVAYVRRICNDSSAMVIHSVFGTRLLLEAANETSQRE